jgi:hypothetical protein
MLKGPTEQSEENSDSVLSEDDNADKTFDDGKNLLEAQGCSCSICVYLSKNKEKVKNQSTLDIMDHFEFGETEIIHQKESSDGLVQYI